MQRVVFEQHTSVQLFAGDEKAFGTDINNIEVLTATALATQPRPDETVGFRNLMDNTLDYCGETRKSHHEDNAYVQCTQVS